MTGSERPLVSVVSLTWNSRRFVDAFVASLLDDVRATSVAAELIVIDNGSTDGTLEQLRKYEKEHSELKVLSLARNLGTTLPRNLGLKRARGEYVLVLDSDTRVVRGTLRALVAGFERRAAEGRANAERVGMIAPRLVYPDGEFQESARRFPTVQTKLLRLLRWDALRQREESIALVLAQTPTPVDYAISAAWFLPRQVLESVGYLDETIFYSPEDVEFCARLWRAGYQIWYCPEVTVVHDCQRLTSKRPFSLLGLSHAKGLVKFWWKYNGFFFRPRRALASGSS